MVIVYQLMNIFLSVFAVVILRLFFDIFFIRRKTNVKVILGWGIYLTWQLFSTRIESFPAYFKILMVVILSVLVCVCAYEGEFLKKCIFVVTFNAIAILFETVCGYVFMMAGIDYMQPMLTGSLVSKSLLFFTILILRLLLNSASKNGISRKYSLLVVCIPVGSIYVVANLFFLNNKQNSPDMIIQSIVSSIILLGINIVIFFVYNNMAKETELRRLNTVYKQQIELYDIHMNERETAILNLRNIRHDMKQKLFPLIEMAEHKKNEEILEYVHSLIDESGMLSYGIARSGNDTIDSLINYKYSVAKSKNIEFSIDLKIPIKIDFSNADLCVILGNALDNAIEATCKLKEEERFVKVAIHYIQNNLSIGIINSFDGELKRESTGKLLTTKPDVSDHGIGLRSIQKAVEKYDGILQIDPKGQTFTLKILLYGKSEKLHRKSEKLHDGILIP